MALPTASTEYFGIQNGSGIVSEIWKRHPNGAVRAHIPNADQYPQHFVQTAPDQVEAEIKRRVLNVTGATDLELQPMNLPPGSCYPRVARSFVGNHVQWPTVHPLADPRDWSSSRSQFGILMERMDSCFRVVEPDPAHFGTFGNEFRNILILAATEVETQFRGILRANKFVCSKPENLWNRNEYRHLAQPLRLFDYEIRLPAYPDVPSLRPFGGWDPQAVKRELRWYDAYNHTKHDRHQALFEASLMNCLEALAALAVIMSAQFGSAWMRNAAFANFIEFPAQPIWNVGDCYDRPEAPAQEWQAIPYPFS